MPSIIDPQTLYVDDLPTIWSPVQWELTEEERREAVEEQQATASLLWSMDALEAILRLLLDETGIERLFGPPAGFNTEEQGDWDEKLITFGPKRAIKRESVERTPTRLELVYNFAELGRWEFVIESEQVTIQQI
ncbi:MAG: hypothetical protein IMZ50_16950 [Candidatus Atribacteria bacterium]|nr:hypothetical protein [Candidatus Atribacteria bacterium]